MGSFFLPSTCVCVCECVWCAFPSFWPLISHGKDYLCIWSWSKLNKFIIQDKVFYLKSDPRGLLHSETTSDYFEKNHLQYESKLKSQPALIYGSRIYPPIILPNALVLLHWGDGHFSTVWKYSCLNLVELRCWVMPTFPCLKFPSNGVIPSLSFPFYSWVGELYFTVEGEGLDMSTSTSPSRAAKYQRVLLLRGPLLTGDVRVDPEWMNECSKSFSLNNYNHVIVVQWDYVTLDQRYDLSLTDEKLTPQLKAVKCSVAKLLSCSLQVVLPLA